MDNKRYVNQSPRNIILSNPWTIEQYQFTI